MDPKNHMKRICKEGGGNLPRHSCDALEAVESDDDRIRGQWHRAPEHTPPASLKNFVGFHDFRLLLDVHPQSVHAFWRAQEGNLIVVAVTA
jgi:hypothetical protein